MKHAIRMGLADRKAHAHHWTDEEKEQIRQQMLSYYDRIGRRNTKPHRTRAEYQAERKRKAEERRAIEAAKPRRPRGRPRKNK